jgi:hypothetical protein
LTETQSTKLTREQLYNEIWEMSVSGAAKKYNVPYTEMLKLCKEADIPIPSSGYWTKLSFGKPVTNIPLPESSVNEVMLPTNTMPKRIRKAAATVAVAEEETPDWEDATELQSEVESPINSEDDLLSYHTVTGGRNVYNREKLYKEVWAKPVVEVAIQYGVSDVSIHKICKYLDVPVPPRGYWARVRAGAKIKKAPLPNLTVHSSHQRIHCLFTYLKIRL